MKRLCCIGSLIGCCIYLGLLTKNYFWDGIWFAQTIENASRWSEVLHPNHLVYNLLGYSLYHLLGGKYRALYILQAMDAVFAAATICVLFGILSELTESLTNTLWLVGLFAFSGTWWRFATDADAYIPGVFFLTLSALLLLPGKKPRPVHVALSHVAAILVHQLAVFFFPAALVALWGQAPNDGRRQRILRAVEYTATAVPLTLGAYFFGFKAQAAGVAGFWAWLGSHSPDAQFSFHLFRNAIISIRSWAQLFLIGRVTLVRFTSPATVVLLLLAAAAAIALVLDLVRGGALRGLTLRHPVVFRWALVWLGAYMLFLLVWLPYHTYYKLLALPAVILLVASCDTRPETHSVRSLACLVVAMAAWNLACGIIPYSRVESNVPAQFALSLRESLRGGAVVYYSDFNTDDSFARYFNPQTQWVRATSPAAVNADLARGNTVWLETTALDRFAREAPAWLAARTVGAKRCDLTDSSHRIQFVMLHPPAQQ